MEGLNRDKIDQSYDFRAQAEVAVQQGGGGLFWMRWDPASFSSSFGGNKQKSIFVCFYSGQNFLLVQISHSL